MWRLLLQAGMDVNHQSSRGSSLHEAAMFARPDVVRLLLSVSNWPSYSSQAKLRCESLLVAAAADVVELNKRSNELPIAFQLQSRQVNFCWKL